jgi:Domain of unknown function (DUF6471)
MTKVSNMMTFACEETTMMEDEFAEKAKRLLRVEMARRGLTYDGLAEKLAAAGVGETPANLRNKVSRGKFTATFLLLCCEVMGVKTLDLVG